MSIVAFVEALLLEPLVAILRNAFGYWLVRAPTPGVALIAFSLIINLVLVPVYREMERAEAAQSERWSKMRAEVARMRKYFRGRERYFYIRTVHRHYRYSPALAVVGSGSIILQMVVFFAAYRYLSSQPELIGVPFGSIRSLSEPDGLLWGLNLLPLVMTALNVAAAFLRSAERRQRIQACLLAAVFLVLLYGSPAGLLVYWTTNNAVALLRIIGKRLWERASPVLWRTWLTQLARLE